MNEERNQPQQKLRVFGLDIHSEIFSSGLLQKRNGMVVDHEILKTWKNVKMDNLEKWVEENSVRTDIFVMEAGCNSFNTAERIIGCGRHAIVLESYKVSRISKTYLKSDDEDAVKTGKVYLSGLATEVWKPDAKTKELRELFASYKRVIKDATRSKNRIWSFLLSQGVKKGKNIELTTKTGKNWVLNKREWTDSQTEILNILIDDFQYSYSQLKRVKLAMAKEVAQNKKMLSLYRIFGINKIIAFGLISVIGDISRFQNPKKLVAYIGLNPNVKETGKKKLSKGMSKWGRKDVRSLLVEGAQSVMRYGNTPIAKWGRKLHFRKAHNVVAIAIARKMIVAVWYILRGFGTKMEVIDKTLETKFSKLAFEIGKETRSIWGYLTVKEFIEDKSRIYVNNA